MKEPLYLSRIGDNTSVTVSPEIINNLLPYQIHGVRFLYQQCILKKHNVILNNEKGMNDARQISALLTAIDKAFPTLIICQSSSVSKWHYEFSKANLKTVTPDELIKEDSLNDETELPDAVILTHEQIKHIKVLPITEWFFYIIDDIELIIKSRFIKNIDTQFRIAITMLNFVANDHSKLQWDILKWTNPSFAEDKNTFIETNDFNKKNLLYPFSEYWRRVTWIFYEKYKPTNTEMNDYDAAVRDWSKRFNLKVPIVSQTVSRQSKKRKCNKIHVNKRSSTPSPNEENNKTPCCTKFDKYPGSIFVKVTTKNTRNHEIKSDKSSGSEINEEIDLLSVEKEKKLNDQKSIEILQTSIKSDIQEENIDSDEENDFKFIIN